MVWHSARAVTYRAPFKSIMAIPSLFRIKIMAAERCTGEDKNSAIPTDYHIIIEKKPFVRNINFHLIKIQFNILSFPGRSPYNRSKFREEEMYGGTDEVHCQRGCADYAEFS